MPAVGVDAPQFEAAGGRGQEGAAHEGAAADQGAAGREGDQKEESEEEGGGVARDPLEACEALGLLVVAVLAGRVQDAAAAVPAGGGGVGGAVAAEVAGELVGVGPQGGSRRGEELAQFGGGDGGAAAGLAGGEEASGAQQGGEEAGDLVDGLAGGLADQVGEGAQHGAEQDAQQDVGQGAAGAVGEDRVDGAGLVDAVRAGAGAAGAVDGAAFAGGGLGVAHDGVGGDEDGVAGALGAPAQVDVVAHEGQAPVEAAEFVVDVAAHEHAGGGDGQDGADLVVLALVLFAAVEAGPAAPAAGDGDAGFEELLLVVPAAELGADDRGVGVLVGDAEQFGEGVRFGGAVVVEEPEPLDGFAVGQVGEVVGVVAPGAADGVPAAGALEVREVLGGQGARGAGGFVDCGAESGAAGQVQDVVVAEGLGEQPRGLVGAAGVGGDVVLRGAFLAEEAGERPGQPAGAVVGDEDRGDDVPGELGCDGRLVGGRRLAVQGHRGTGPPAGGPGVVCPRRLLDSAPP